MAKKNKKKKTAQELSEEQRVRKAQKEKAKAQVKRAVQATEQEIAAQAPEAASDAEADAEAERIALKVAMDAARESAAVLREAANALSQSAAQSVAAARWGQFPGQNMGIPAAGMAPMLPPYHQEGMRPPAGMPAGSYDDPYADMRDREMRESAGYSPKEPADVPSADGRGGKRWGSPIKSLKSRVAAVAGGGQQKAGRADAAMLSGLPKFGEAPDPLPSPQEILASLPSFDVTGRPTAPEPQPSSEMAYQSGQVAEAAFPTFADPTSFPVEMPLSQVPPVQEQVIEIPAQEVVYGEVQMPDPYVQAYDPMQGYDPSVMYDPTQAFDPAMQMQGYDPAMQGYDPYAYGGMAYDPYADPTLYAGVGVPPKGGMATASLILGILSILVAFLPPLGIVLAVLAIVLAKAYAKKGGMAPRAGTGRVCGVVGLVLSIVLAIAIGVFVAYFVGGLYGESNAGAIMGYLQTTPLAQFL